MKEDLILIDLTRIVKDMLYVCIERMFGLTNGCRIIERVFCRLLTMILVCSTGKARDHLKEREDKLSIIFAENWDILLRNALGEYLVVFVAKMWTMKCWISTE
jgi:hypothetical protein